MPVNLCNRRVRKGHNGSYIEGASHVAIMLNPRVRTKAINRAVKMLKPVADKFDSIVCTGVSGLLVAPDVAKKLKKDLLIVRKEENRHSIHVVEGVWEPRRYIIIDDLCESGKSVKRMVEAVTNHRDHRNTEFVGAWFYIWEVCKGGWYNPETFYKDSENRRGVHIPDLGVR